MNLGTRLLHYIVMIEIYVIESMCIFIMSYYYSLHIFSNCLVIEMFIN